MGIRTNFDRIWPINWANINIFELNQLYMKGKHELYIFYEYQLNIYLTVDSVVKSSQKLNKIAHISVRDIQQLTSFKIIELNRVSKKIS